jgi:phage shock protein PspC (stress-responsive transcriptional regulator)
MSRFYFIGASASQTTPILLHRKDGVKFKSDSLLRVQLFSFDCVKQIDKRKEQKMSDYKTLTRSKSNRMIAGVCAGLADYLNVDPTVVRLLFVLGIFLAGPGIAIVYLIMAIVTPEQ